MLENKTRYKNNKHSSILKFLKILQIIKKIFSKNVWQIKCQLAISLNVCHLFKAKNSLNIWLEFTHTTF